MSRYMCVFTAAKTAFTRPSTLPAFSPGEGGLKPQVAHAETKESLAFLLQKAAMSRKLTSACWSLLALTSIPGLPNNIPPLPRLPPYISFAGALASTYTKNLMFTTRSLDCSSYHVSFFHPPLGLKYLWDFCAVTPCPKNGHFALGPLRQRPLIWSRQGKRLRPNFGRDRWGGSRL